MEKPISFIKKYVVSGPPRSGTSALMSAFRACGVPISGYKYPVMLNVNDNKLISGGTCMPVDEDTLQTNPTGLWEVNGVTKNGLIPQNAHLHGDGKVIKVVDTYLPVSDLSYFEGVIATMREPRKILTSQLKLAKKPETQFEVNGLAWLLAWNFRKMLDWVKMTRIPLKFVIYEKFISEPIATMTDLCEWIGRGQPQFAEEAIQPRLDRSKPVTVDGPGISFMEDMYYKAKKGDYRGLYVEYKFIKKELDEWYFKSIEENNKGGVSAS